MTGTASVATDEGPTSREAAAVEQFEQALQLRAPADVAISRDGRRVAFAVGQPAGPDGAARPAEVWIVDEDGAPARVAAAATSYARLHWSPGGDALAVLAGSAAAAGLALHRIDLGAGDVGPSERVLARWPGSAEDVRWSDDGAELLVLVADPGSDLSSLEGALRLRDEPSDPAVTRPHTAWRRLFRVPATGGATVEVQLPGHTVWEFDWRGGSRAAAVVSTSPSEDAWYDAALAEVNLATGTVTVHHRPQWQVAVPRLSPDGDRIAAVEGFGSDRGLVTGSIRCIDLTSDASTVLAPELEDVAWIEWPAADTIGWTGWDGLGSSCGQVHPDGGAELVWRGPAALGHGSQTRFATSASGAVVAVHEDSARLPEVARQDASIAGGWRRLTDFNEELAARLVLPLVQELTWTAADGTLIQGLVARPPEASGSTPLVVIVHGGPSARFTHSAVPSSHVLPLVHAGYTVLLPNPRGSTGRGPRFGQGLLRDIGGIDLDDILGGIDACVAADLAIADRVAVMGKSYGGYMAAWAATRTDRFAASIPMSCISDWVSNHYTSNLPHGAEILLGGHPGAPGAEHFTRSPVAEAPGSRTPTLIIHGELDLCTPPGQAYELYNALVEAGAEVELVMYPREGHGLSEYGHKVDLCHRIVRWLDSHL